VAVVVFPMLVDFDHYPYHRLHRRVAREARRHGFSVLDLFEAFALHDAATLQLLPGDTTHPGDLGHRLAAERIHAFLRQEGLPRKPEVLRRSPASSSSGSSGPGE
jgi:lysophospholipase L1-like esterase